MKTRRQKIIKRLRQGQTTAEILAAMPSAREHHVHNAREALEKREKEREKERQKQQEELERLFIKMRECCTSMVEQGKTLEEQLLTCIRMGGSNAQIIELLGVGKSEVSKMRRRSKEIRERTGLKRKDGQRETFTGEFVRFGTKSGWRGQQAQTILLRNIKDADGNLIADHLWFNYTKGFQAVNRNGELQDGDVIQFDARVKSYLKGYFGRRQDVWKPAEWDYKLSHPTKITRLEGRV